MNIKDLSKKRFIGKGKAKRKGRFAMKKGKGLQYVKRAENAVTRVTKSGIGYERVMNLLTMHAEKVSRLDDRVVSLEERTFCLNRIYELMEQVQQRQGRLGIDTEVHEVDDSIRPDDPQIYEEEVWLSNAHC